MTSNSGSGTAIMPAALPAGLRIYMLALYNLLYQTDWLNLTTSYSAILPDVAKIYFRKKFYACNLLIKLIIYKIVTIVGIKNNYGIPFAF
jgi:hypothetical protein